jgi:hypothetical protein
MVMTSTLRDSGVCDELFMPYRHLAIRVLTSALRDVAALAGSQTNRESALWFFADSPMLFHWCRVAALDPSLVARHATRLAARDGRSGHRGPARPRDVKSG